MRTRPIYVTVIIFSTKYNMPLGCDCEVSIPGGS